MDPRSFIVPPIVRRIHNPVLPGASLLLLREGLLVRWPARTPLPAIGDPFTGRVVDVPPELADTVQTLLFGSSPIARCDAAKQLAQTRQTRTRILLRIYSRSYAQHLLAAADRLVPEIREKIAASSQPISVYRLTRGIHEPANCNGGPRKRG